MNRVANKAVPEIAAVAPTVGRSRLFRKYAALFLAVVAVALVFNGVLDIWFSYQEQKELLIRIQREQAKLAAEKIGQFVREIEDQMLWETQLPLETKSTDEWRFDTVRLLRQAPAVTEIAQLDASGRERFRMSRQAMDVIGSLSDFSHDPLFSEAMANKIYYGPVYFVHESEPYMTIAEAGAHPEDGVVVAQVNLKLIWDVVSQIKVGARGLAYVVDSRGQLIAHPDLSLVLSKTDVSHLVHVAAARALGLPESGEHSGVALDLNGHKVLSAYARVAPLGWLVFTELPIEEAYAPLYEALFRSGLLLLAALALAFFAGLLLARRMVGPIRTLSEGAAQIGSGDLTQRIAIKTGDELEALGDQFNSMAARLQESYATLERKVEERTSQLEIANQAKSRFLATASHDLRQPLHALGLFVAQLRGRTGAADRKRIVAGIEAALSGMNELFNALLDISKLDAGVLVPKVAAFPVSQLLRRIDTTFAGLAREKGLALRIVGSDAWIRSDFILLEQIVLNLMTNAIRYTATGGVLVGCRRRGDRLRIEVWDTGSGIPPELHQHIFSEFYRVETSERDHAGGLGLGLAIVDRLCRLLDHPIELKSTVGKGSCFAITVPAVPAPAKIVKTESAAPPRFTAPDKNLVVVIDDDPLVLEGMGGLIRSWGCSVVTGNTDGAVLDGLAKYHDPPNVIISDYHLRGGKTGIEAIARLREALTAPIPAFLMSGDTNPDPQRDAQSNGYALLHKPVDPAALRVMLTQVLKKRPETVAH
jgi:signal transduction histidine kinase/CheY-like chemotaxis protein